MFALSSFLFVSLALCNVVHVYCVGKSKSCHANDNDRFIKFKCFESTMAFSETSQMKFRKRNKNQATKTTAVAATATSTTATAVAAAAAEKSGFSLTELYI